MAKICNLWTIWPVIQPINNLFTSMEHWARGLLSDFEKMVYKLNYRPECPDVADFCYFGIITIRYP